VLVDISGPTKYGSQVIKYEWQSRGGLK